jgi:hypothetical protein
MACELAHVGRRSGPSGRRLDRQTVVYTCGAQLAGRSVDRSATVAGARMDLWFCLDWGPEGVPICLLAPSDGVSASRALAAGSTGFVQQAMDTSTGELVAIK